MRDCTEHIITLLHTAIAVVKYETGIAKYKSLLSDLCRVEMALASAECHEISACPICDGEGSLNADCPTCLGTGWGSRDYEMAEALRLICDECNGEGAVLLDCHSCDGTGIAVAH